MRNDTETHAQKKKTIMALLSFRSFIFARVSLIVPFAIFRTNKHLSTQNSVSSNTKKKERKKCFFQWVKNGYNKKAIKQHRGIKNMNKIPLYVAFF